MNLFVSSKDYLNVQSIGLFHQSLQTAKIKKITQV